MEGRGALSSEMRDGGDKGSPLRRLLLGRSKPNGEVGFQRATQVVPEPVKCSHSSNRTLLLVSQLPSLSLGIQRLTGNILQGEWVQIKDKNQLQEAHLLHSPCSNRVCQCLNELC